MLFYVRHVSSSWLVVSTCNAKVKMKRNQKKQMMAGVVQMQSVHARQENRTYTMIGCFLTPFPHADDTIIMLSSLPPRTRPAKSDWDKDQGGAPNWTTHFGLWMHPRHDQVEMYELVMLRCLDIVTSLSSVHRQYVNWCTGKSYFDSNCGVNLTMAVYIVTKSKLWEFQNRNIKCRVSKLKDLTAFL